jgi:lipoprotein-anchoring transpeptidase ErfK/SrfK
VKRAAFAALWLVAAAAHADVLLPPWTAANDVPLPLWAHSVAPEKAETVVVAAPGRLDLPRATTLDGARLPLYGATRGRGCGGRWLHVGLEAWICSDAAALSPDPPSDGPAPVASDGLPYRYYFVGKNGASGYTGLERAGDEAPDEQLDPGFAVATVEERAAHGTRWVRTRHGTWIDTSELGAASPSSFAGEEVHGAGPGSEGLDFAWVLPGRLNVYSTPNRRGKAASVLTRREVVRWREAKAAAGGVLVRISEDGVSPGRWVDARGLARPTLAAPPPEVRGPDERWIDVDLASQTLVAYEGARPVFATLVSTGVGAPGTDTATHKGTFRIWVKLLSSTMANLEKPENEDAHPAAEGLRYSMEDVPYVQFFDKAIALHGVFWHDEFGRVHSHGCVNLAPRDAARLFLFTGPRLGPGLSAVLPSRLDPGTVVRVR